MTTTVADNHALIAASMSEDELLANVIDAARKLGWRVAHFRPAKTGKGWRTAVQGDGVGFPDLLLLRGAVGLAVELKSERGRMTAEQDIWLGYFNTAGFESYLWRPRDLLSGAIERVLLGDGL